MEEWINVFNGALFFLLFGTTAARKAYKGVFCLVKIRFGCVRIVRTNSSSVAFRSTISNAVDSMYVAFLP